MDGRHERLRNKSEDLLQAVAEVSAELKRLMGHNPKFRIIRSWKKRPMPPDGNSSA